MFDDMKSISDLEQVGAHIRDEYLELPDNVRDQFRDWVTSLAAIANDARGAVLGSVCVHLPVRSDVDGEKITVVVSPNMLVRAIAAWDRDEEYITGSLEP